MPNGAERAVAADDCVGACCEGACGLACGCIAGWHRLVVAFFAGVDDWSHLGWSSSGTERREHHETAGQPAAAAVSRTSGEGMDFNSIATADDGGMEIGEKLRNKALSGLRGRPCRKKHRDQTGQIPAGGSAADAWGLMNVLGSWPVIPSSESDGLKLEVYNTLCMTPGVNSLVGAVARAIEHGKEPQRSTEGLGGTYFIRNDAGDMVAIFKPCDEEPMAPNNPKGFVGRSLGAPGLKPTVRVGEAAIREVAAYLLDKDGFAKVPHTILVRASHKAFNYSAAPTISSAIKGDSSDLSHSPSLESNLLDKNESLSLKVGSLQQFVSHMCDTSEMGTSRFNVRNVHHIGIFDIRLYNTDRHAGNILVRKPRVTGGSKSDLASLDKGQLELVPIDHGFCLPEALEAPYFEWLYWPQAMLPFGEEELKYIADLDIEADKNLLRNTLPILPEECLRTLEVATVLLKKCAAAGLSLHEIGQVMSRPLVGMDKEQSELEKMCIASKEALEAYICDRNRRDSLSDSDDTESSCLETPTRMKADQLQFCIDDVQDVKDVHPKLDVASSSFSGCNTSGRQLSFSGESLGSSLGRLSIGTDDKEPAKKNLATPIQTSRMGFHKPSRSVSVQIPLGHAPDRQRCLGLRTPVRQRKLSMQISCPSRGDNQVYPPPVEGAAPSSTNDIFSHMGDGEWRFFMDILTDRIEDALIDGHWKMQDAIRGQGQPPSNFGMSCPRF